MSRYLHVFSDSPYTAMFVKFINKNFDINEHEFIILCKDKKSKFLDIYDSYHNTNITYKKNIYFSYKDKFKKSKKIIIHQLNKPTLMATLILLYPSAFQKMTWVIWGGDLYFYQFKSKSLKDSALEFLRKNTIARIPTIVSYIKGDYDKAIEIYGSKAKYIKAKYPSPIDVQLIESIPLYEKKNDTIVIMVGNSADSSNEHIEAFQLLEKFKNENIKIVSVLSYGGTQEYIDRVIDIGRSIFKEKFESVLNYMDFNDYLKFINRSDICLFNHKRQQGLGNQMVLFALHKKVYINSMTTPFKYYNDIGIDIYSTEAINNMDFATFIEYSHKKKVLNRKLILEDISDQTVLNEWRNVFK